MCMQMPTSSSSCWFVEKKKKATTRQAYASGIICSKCIPSHVAIAYVVRLANAVRLYNGLLSVSLLVRLIVENQSIKHEFVEI